MLSLQILQWGVSVDYLHIIFCWDSLIYSQCIIMSEATSCCAEGEILINIPLVHNAQ